MKRDIVRAVEQKNEKSVNGAKIDVLKKYIGILIIFATVVFAVQTISE